MIAIHVHRNVIPVEVGENSGIPAALVIELKRGNGIEVKLGIIHHRGLKVKRFFVGRLAMLEVDLAGHRFHSIDYGTYALADLYAFEPLTRHIV